MPTTAEIQGVLAANPNWTDAQIAAAANAAGLTAAELSEATGLSPAMIEARALASGVPLTTSTALSAGTIYSAIMLATPSTPGGSSAEWIAANQLAGSSGAAVVSALQPYVLLDAQNPTAANQLLEDAIGVDFTPIQPVQVVTVAQADGAGMLPQTVADPVQPPPSTRTASAAQIQAAMNSIDVPVATSPSVLPQQPQQQNGLIGIGLLALLAKLAFF